MVNLDMWYGDNVKDCNYIDIFFNDLGAYYWGNIYKNNKCIGGYTADNSVEIEETFRHILINWEI